MTPVVKQNGQSGLGEEASFAPYPGSRGNPYLGPRPFSPEDSWLFFGRDREAAYLLELLAEERIVLLHAPSGAGMTSLIQAALIPRLIEEGHRVVQLMRFHLEPQDPVAQRADVPTSRYIQSVLLGLEETHPPEDQLPLSDLAALTLDEYLNLRWAAGKETRGTVLIFDHLEEILADPGGRAEEKEAFFAQVGQALKDPGRRALFALREEYLGPMQPYSHLLPGGLRTTYRLEPLGPEGARQAIQEAARSAGVEFTDDAAEKLVDELRTVRVQRRDGSVETRLVDDIEPLQLQLVCYALWENLPEGTTAITLEEIQTAGDVGSALASYYAQAVARTAAEMGVPERAVRDWVDRELITEAGTRGVVPLGARESGGLDNRAIEYLIEAHLVRTEQRRGDTWVELVHDRFIEPVKADNAAWREAHRSLLQQQAREWDLSSKSSELLLRDDALAEAEAWAATHAGALTDLEHEFLRASLGRAPGTLQEILADGDQETRLQVVAQLGERADAEAVDLLLDALEQSAPPSGLFGRLPGRQRSQNREMRQAIAQALGQIGDDQAVPPLIAQLEDPDAGPRRAAAEALGLIGDVRALTALRAATQDSDPSVRDAARRAVEQFDQFPDLGAGDLDRYEIVEELARGGFLTVYRARDTLLDREVALKLMVPLLQPLEGELLARYEQEASDFARAQHPNIVLIYDYGIADGRPFLVEELVGDGSTLRAVLEAQGSLPAARALPILAQAAGALEYLHQMGIVHQNVDPGNLLLEGAGDSLRVVLVDAVLARAMQEAARVEDTGTMVGTAGYMAPEQFSGLEIGPETDVYSLGLVAYEMLAGRPPFEGDDIEQMVAQARQTPPSPQEFAPELNDEVSRVLLQALAKSPQERYASAGEFVGALQDAAAIAPAGDEEETEVGAGIEPQIWLVSANPEQYDWDRAFAAGSVRWTEARGAEAQRNIRSARPGDLVLAYRSTPDKYVTGLGRIASVPYEHEDRHAVQIDMENRFERGITLDELKIATPDLQHVTRRRPVSVSPVTPGQWAVIRALILYHNREISTEDLPPATVSPVRRLEILTLQAPDEVETGGPLQVTIHLRNRGNVTWQEGEEVLIGYSLRAEEEAGEPSQDDRVRTEQIEEEIPPGGNLMLQELNLEPSATAEAGQYKVHWSAAHLHGDEKSEPARFVTPLVVRTAPPKAPDEILFFNGVDGATGEYLLPPLPAREVARIAQGEPLDEGHLRELRHAFQRQTQATLGLRAGVDPQRLDESGWGIIFAFEDQDRVPAVREALSELLDLRREQAGDRYREFAGPDAYRPGESKAQFLARHGMGPGPADPDTVPYYLLIVGDPEAIPYRFQYQLDVQYAAGRLHFDTLEEYAQYARSVVTAESGQMVLPPEAVFFGAQNPDDRHTDISARQLLSLLAELLAQSKPDLAVQTFLGERASKAQLARLLGRDQVPALLVTATHGLGFSADDPRQLAHQGALLCQDWPGPQQWQGPIPQDFYLAADDVGGDARLLGLMAYHFASFSAGTPRLDEFAQRAVKERVSLAPHAFVASLPRRLLGHPRGGALAVIGHVDRVWSYSFHWEQAAAQLAAYQVTLDRLITGYPVGSAVEPLSERYAELSSILSDELEEIQFGKKVDPRQLAGLWAANNDARSLVILGDPAARLPVRPDGPRGRREIDEVHLAPPATEPLTYADILIRIRARGEPAGAYPVEAALDDGRLFQGEMHLDREALLMAELDAQRYGRLLTDALFSGPVREAFVEAAGRAKGRVRVRLWLDEDDADLHALAWERLLDPTRDPPEPLAASARTPFSRLVDLPPTGPGPLAERPIRLLFAVANPVDLEGFGLSPIDVDGEAAGIYEVLGELQARGQIQVTVLPGRPGLSPELRGKLESEGVQVLDGAASLQSLGRHLSGQHILHLMAHGAVRSGDADDPDLDAIFLEEEDGTLSVVRGGDLDTMLTTITPGPSLVFLASCQTSGRRWGLGSGSVGLGYRLVRAGVPAVVAMQDDVTLEAVRHLSAAFYSRLLDHGTVDLAMNEARGALFAPGEIEWAIPALYSRAEEGQIFAPSEPAWLNILSASAQEALLWAEGCRQAVDAPLVTSMHLLAGLYQHGVSTRDLLTLFDDDDTIRRLLSQQIASFTRPSLSDVEPVSPEALPTIPLSDNVSRTLRAATDLAEERGATGILSQHLLVGLLGLEDAAATRWIADTLQVGGQELYRLVAEAPDGELPLDEIRHLSQRDKPYTVLRGHEQAVTALAFSPDRTTLASGGADNTVRLWNLADGSSRAVLTGHGQEITGLAVTPDGSGLVSASRDQTIKLWDLAGGEERLTLEGHTLDVMAVTVTPDGQQVVSAGQDSAVRVWDLISGDSMALAESGLVLVADVAVTPDGRRAVSGTLATRPNLKVWDLQTGQELQALQADPVGVVAVGLTPNGSQIVSGSLGGKLEIWDLATGERRREIEAHEQAINDLVVTADGQRVITSSSDGSLKVWDLRTGLEICTATGFPDEVQAVALASDGRTLAIAAGPVVQLWDLEELIAYFGGATDVTVPWSPWYLNLEAPPIADLKIGEAFSLKVHLTASEQAGSEPLRLPFSAQEVTLYVEAHGFHLAGSHRRHLAASQGQILERGLSLDLVPLIPGRQEVRLLAYPGRQIEGLQPAELAAGFSIPPPEALPDIPEMIDRRAIPDPQADVTLYVTLLDVPDGQRLQYHLTCPALGLDREPLAGGSQPLRLTEQDLAALRKAATQAAAGAALAPPRDVLTGLRALGMALFDQLIPFQHPLRGVYWRVVRLALESESPLSWLVVSDERAVLPWELVCPYWFDRDTKRIQHDDFLAGRFILAHWVGRQGLTLAGEAPLGLLNLTHYQQRPHELSRWEAVLGGEDQVRSEDQAGHLALMQPGSPYYGLHVLRYTERGQRGRITRRDDRDPDPQAGWSEAEAMVYGGRLDFTLRRPVVGLSMLSEQPVDEVQLEAGWMLPLMHAGATALVGPRWPVPPETDQLFYRTFYELIREAGLPLGWAAWEARDRVRAAFPHRPDWLAYAYFGHPWCQPYRVRAAGGFALFEAINHPEGKPFETGQHYTFRASYRSEAPDWYEGRLRRQEASVEGNGLSVLVMKLNGEAPETYPLERVPAGESFQCMVRLAMPEQETRLPVLIRFQRGDEELQSLVMNLDVKEM